MRVELDSARVLDNSIVSTEALFPEIEHIDPRELH
jgi:hypothetical protein